MQQVPVQEVLVSKALVPKAIMLDAIVPVTMLPMLVPMGPMKVPMPVPMGPMKVLVLVPTTKTTSIDRGSLTSGEPACSQGRKTSSSSKSKRTLPFIMCLI